MPEFDDRFELAKYADEQPHAYGRASGPPDSWFQVPATVSRRLLAVGAAYDLHVLGSVLTDGVEQDLNREQCEQLVDELTWVGNLLNDPLVATYLPAIRDQALACARSRRAEDALHVDLEA